MTLTETVYLGITCSILVYLFPFLPFIYLLIWFVSLLFVFIYLFCFLRPQLLFTLKSLKFLILTQRQSFFLTLEGDFKNVAIKI